MADYTTRNCRCKIVIRCCERRWSMAKRQPSTSSKSFFLRVPQVHYQVRQQIPPVVLEQRCLRMVDQPAKLKTTTATTTVTTTTFTTTSATTIPTAPSVRITAATVTTTAALTTTTPSTRRPVPAASTTAIAKTPPTIRLAVCPRKSESVSPASTPSPTLPIATVRTSAPSSPTLTPSLPSPARELRATTAAILAGDGDYASTAIVGGKHPVEEKGPQIVLLQPSNGEGDDEEGVPKQHREHHKQHQQLSDTTESERSRSRKQELHSATTTSKLSTREHAQSRDQPYRERSHSEGRPSVHFTLAPVKRDEAHVMEFFQEQEKNLQESFLSLPKQAPRKQRSPSPRVQQNAGLEHLDNLVRLMQQLTSLKDENVRLRKRCDFLESTKILLEAKRELSPEGDEPPSGVMTLLPKQKHHAHHHHHHHHKPTTKSRQATTFPAATRGDGIGRVRPRLSSAEEFELLERATSSSDQRMKPAKKAMHKRSFSTGSLEVPSDMLLDEVDTTEHDDKPSKSKGTSLKQHSSKQKSKSSKWAQLKKVLTGQKLYEDLGTTIRSLREFGRSTQGRYPTIDPPSTGSEITSSYSQRCSSEMSDHAAGQSAETSKGTTTSFVAKVTAEPSLVGENDSELTTDIWMGPPDWWEEYEANKDGDNSVNSDVSSVIEVTTMYLGPKRDIMSTSQTTTISATSATSRSTTSPTQERQLGVGGLLTRRKSSPSLSLQDAEDDKSLLEECATKTRPIRLLHKSSSCKSVELDLQKGGDGKESKKSHRTAWDRVKDIIIHTRKADSMKRKHRKEKSGLTLEPEESSEIDMEAFLDDQWGTEFFAEGLLSRSTPKTSPMIIRQQQQSSGKDVDASAKSTGALSKSGPSSGTSPPGGAGTVDITALLGRSMSDDFNKKMQQWEEMKSRKSTSFRASIEESDIGSLDISQSSQDFPLRTVDLRDLHGTIPEATTESLTTEESNTSTETQGAHYHHVEGMQRKMTDSFSRKMLEWEKRKYKSSPGSARDASPEIERKGSKGRKDERQKSKRSREEKEKEKFERQREREKQKVEREQVKLEKEMLRIEKERLRALEREAKLEKLKGRLSQSEADAESFRNPILSPLAEYKVTADFARKLHEWELRKGLSHDMSNSMYLEAQKMKMHQLKEGRLDSDASRQGSSPRFTYDRRGEEGAEGGEKSPPSPLVLQPFWDSPEDTSPIEKYSDASQGDETSVTEEYQTTANIPTLERANAQLLQELRKKEAEYSAVQDEVHQLNTRLAKVRQEHASEMARYHRDIAMGTQAEPVKLEVGELEQSMVELEEKIQLIENVGEKLAVSMESAAVGKWQSIEGEDTVHTQLVDLVGQMRSMLVHATQSEEASQKTSALSNFETLYSQAMKLQVEMNNLRLSHLERNREIMVIKRQLLLQEVNNLVLQADITRRETELYQFSEAKRFSSLKKWNTFGGSDRQRPQAQIELPTPIIVTSQQKSRGAKLASKENSVERLSERVPVPTSTKSAPSSPLSKLTEDTDLSTSFQLSNGHSHSEEGKRPEERSTDHRELHLLTPVFPRRQRESPPQPEALEANVGGASTGTRSSHVETTRSLHLPAVVAGLSAEAGQTDRRTSPVLPEKPSATDSGVGVGQAHMSAETSVRQMLSSKAVVEHSARTTSYDSEPIHRELEALRRARRKVGEGSPTLIEKRSQDSSPVPSPGLGPGTSGSKPETPDQFIPQRPLPLGKPKPQRAAALMDDNISPLAQSVIECTDLPNISDQTQPTAVVTCSSEGDGAISPSVQEVSPVSSAPLSTLPPISDQARGGSRSPRSPVAKQKLLRRQHKDNERETKLKEYSAISPKGSPVAARGKPPLPRQNTPVRQSPSSSPSISEKGTRSKSHGDVDTVAPASPTIKPLQEAINKFEKRATVCETEDRPIELRKTPSPTLHLPRVGLVSRVRKLKPAAELLEESQRYRSGQSIYATRILQKYLPKEESKLESQKTSHNKENVSGTYVHAIVQRLSRETTPVRSGTSSRTNSNGSLHWPDSPRAQSELVSHIVKKFTNSSGPDSQPLNDCTNEGQLDIQTKIYDGQVRHSKSEPSTSTTEQDPQKQSPLSESAKKSLNRNSGEVFEVILPSTSQMTESSFTSPLMVSSGSAASGGDHDNASDTPSSPTSHKSMPSLPYPSQRVMKAESIAHSGSEKDAYSPSNEEDVGIEAEFSSQASGSSSSKKREVKGRSKEKREEKSVKVKSESRRFPSSLSPIRREARKPKMDTVGVLCKQSISFDLGVSLHTRDDASSSDKKASKSRKPRSWDPSESAAMEAARDIAVAITAASTTTTTTISTSDTAIGSGEAAEGGIMSGGAEGEIASPSSSSPPSKEKRRPRRFLDANWLQRSKRFFKGNK